MSGAAAGTGDVGERTESIIKRTGSIIELTEFFVEPPLRDGASALVRRLGLFSSMQAATAWLAQRIEREAADADDDALVYYVAVAIVLDAEERHSGGAVYDRHGRLRGALLDDGERPWGGRPASECRFTPGELVGFVDREAYCVGVVLAQPPPPESAARGGATAGDDVYLVGLLDAQGSATRNDHEHLAESLLFEIAHELAPELREALGKRFALSGWAEARA